MRIQAVSLGHPDAARLIAEVQQEYVARYGGEDGTPVTPAEFAPPAGLFLVGYEGEAAVACGGWRSRGPDAEIKRMYVARPARRRGLARLMLAELERTAREAGRRRAILETGSKQPEAVALYRSAGYTEIPAFGQYACAPHSMHLGKLLASGPPPAGPGPAPAAPGQIPSCADRASSGHRPDGPQAGRPATPLSGNRHSALISNLSFRSVKLPSAHELVYRL